MSDHHAADLTATLKELQPQRRQLWDNFMKSTVIVSVMIAVILLLMLVGLVIL